jgi:hypothetical protein
MSSTDQQLRRVAPALTAGAVLLALPALYLVDPNTTHVPMCPLHAATGLWCPLCGATRATHALLHGDLATALHDNLLFVAVLPLVLLAWWRWAGRGQRPDHRPLLPRPVFVAVLVLAIVFAVLRNLPVGDWLAPPA